MMIAIAVPAAAQLSVTGSDGDTFLKALREGDGSKAFSLVERSSTVVNYRGDKGEAALHIVVRTHNSNWLDYLLSNGANPDVADNQGETPLLMSIRTNYLEAAARLLRARAQIDKANRLGETPLIVAVQQRSSPLVTALLKLGANPDKTDHAGYSARDYAKRDNRSREMSRLIDTVKAQAIKPVG